MSHLVRLDRLSKRVRSLIKILLIFFVGIYAAHAEPPISLSAGDVHSPLFHVKGIQLSLAGTKASALNVQVNEVAIQGKVWRNLNFSCPRFQFADGLIRCGEGVLRLSRSVLLLVTFTFSFRDQTLDLKIRTNSRINKEDWRLSARWGGAEWEGVLTISNGQVAYIARFLPESAAEIVPAS
ncbi:MAG TPA: hypothetical protein VIU43_03090, partial [Nitrosospira sp.]